jgi:protoporphyrinogen oxidase
LSFFETVFLGGGLSCLAAAGKYTGDSVLLEKSSRIGGLCRSWRVNGHTFDCTGHLLHLSQKKIQRVIFSLEGVEFNRIKRDSWVYSKGVYTRYPFQSHFFGLPKDVVFECLMGLIQAQARKNKRYPKSFHAWVLQHFGPGVARHFLFPYNQKLWTVSPRTLGTQWLGRYFPNVTMEDVVRGALSDVEDEQGYNAHFFYPKTGGIEALVRALAAQVHNIRCHAEVVKVNLEKRILQLADGEEIRFGRLVSCVPLKNLIAMILQTPRKIRKAAAKLRASCVYNLNLGIRERDPARHWVYVPEPGFSLYRFGYLNHFAKSMAPDGMASVYTEIAYRNPKTLDEQGLKDKVKSDLITMGVIESPRDVVLEKAFHINPAYPIYDGQRGASVTALLAYLRRNSVYSIGRYGRWEYSSMEDALGQGLDIAENELNC